MDWSQVALIAAFALLLQSDLLHAASCNNRKTVIQIQVPRKTNINVKIPENSGLLKFVPFVNSDNKDKYDADCFVWNGPRYRKCTSAENENPSSSPSSEQTNIIIDLGQLESDSKNKTQNNDSKNKTSSPTSQDGTVVVLQDLTSASSASKSTSSNSVSNGGQTAASSAASAAISASDIIASFNPTSPGGDSKGNTEDIFIQDDATSIAGSSATSNVKNNPEPAPNKKTPAPNTTSLSSSTGKAIAKTGNSNLLISKTAAASNVENTSSSSNGDDATSSAGVVPAKATSSIADSTDSKMADDSVTAFSQIALFDDVEI